MAKTLTAAAVKNHRPGKKRREIPDGGCPGLHLVVQPSGAKSWALRYRRPDKRTAKLALGSVFERDGQEPNTEPVIGGHLTLAAAHRLVAELRHQIAQGRDPGASYIAERERRRAPTLDRAANTFSAAARDFVEQYASKKTRRWEEQARLLGIRPEDLTLMPKGLADRWDKRPIAEIDGHDIYGVVDETRRSGAPGLARRSDGPTEARARAMLSCLSRMFRWLIQHRRISLNPCSGVHRPDTPKARDRVLTDAEIGKFWSAANAERTEFSAPLKLLLLTGCRLNEVAGMTWGELSDNCMTWNIPGGRTKNGRPHLVPLAPLAQEILAGVKETAAGQNYIFSTTDGISPVSGWSKIKNRMDQRMKIPHWRLHDLRRTAATGMAEIGIAPHIVEAALNHISGAKAGVAGVYNRAQYAAEKKAALERWAQHVQGLACGEPSNVVDMPNKKRKRP
ncbi:site-specific integrase [Bradyrhizobium sp. AUGA SZCCT0042]|uniref:tyrosine-type recombinase/integrase n=1 Tax=Bradyrhizobium sp. AUGA SZCCT0042 TaxID=2807651 RepID=UPI001BA582CC|nr:site-specific integrase [Bradyrhizobium sp. AUGA SZCCT0042]MBR1296660.1 tyrosine-type recombinase/integrase [Bradyrhizobium sp. AUGA SZCCT0042]